MTRKTDMQDMVAALRHVIRLLEKHSKKDPEVANLLYEVERLQSRLENLSSK